MRKWMMALACLALAAGCCGCGDNTQAVPGAAAATPPQKVAAGQWTLASWFCAAENPSGPWSWGQSRSGALGAFEPFIWHGVNYDGLNIWGMTGYTGRMMYSASFFQNTQAYPVVGTPPGGNCFHPGPNHEKAVVRWTSPVAGPVHITGSFGQGDTGSVDVFIIKTDGDGTVTGKLFQALNTASAQSFDLLTTVAAGDTIDFVLGDAGSWLLDNTPIEVTITPEVAAATPPQKVAAGQWTLASWFCATENPSGPWSWGESRSGALGAFELFPWHGKSPQGTNVWAMKGFTGDMLWSAHFWMNDQPHAIGDIAPGETSFHPGPNHEKAVVRWTSPIAGPVRIEGSFGQSGYRSVDLYIIKTDGHGKVTGSLFQMLSAASAQSFDLTTTVAQGETIDFVLGDAGSWIGDNTPIAVTITPQ